MDVVIVGASVLTNLVLLWTLWTRRFTWRDRWETASTVNVGFMATAAFLVAPRPSIGSFIGRWFNSLTHLSNLQFFLAHACVLGGEGAMVFYAVSRLMPDEEFRTWFLTRVKIPIAVGVCAMFAVFAGSSASDRPDPHFLIDPVNGPIFAAYWVLYGVLILYLLYHSTRGFIDLWHDPLHGAWPPSTWLPAAGR